MIAEFEQRLADVLGARLAPPLAGLVDVAPGRDQARVVLSVRKVMPLEEHLLTVRPEVVPGAVAPRRVARLRCDVGLDVRRLANQTRADQMSAFDELVYALDDVALRGGAPLLPGDGTDPGFVIGALKVSLAEPPASLTLSADGLFWPANVPGETGTAIAEARVRLVLEPLRFTPAVPRPVAGGPPLVVEIDAGVTGTLRLESGGRVTAVPFGSVVLSVVDAGGRAGAGTLVGAGPGGARVVALAGGRASVEYTPPAAPARDVLVVSIDDGTGGAGLEVARLPLTVRAA
jgi:hypothetical protein